MLIFCGATPEFIILFPSLYTLPQQSYFWPCSAVTLFHVIDSLNSADKRLIILVGGKWVAAAENDKIKLRTGNNHNLLPAEHNAVNE